MKLLQVILSLSLLLVPLLVVASSSSLNDNNITTDSSLNDASIANITRGSSLFLNDTTPYWLSPSGNIAFGFYQLPSSPNQYTVGIWFIKSSHKTLVWTANHKDLIPAVHEPSSITFTEEGKLVLWIMAGNNDKLLLSDAAEPVSYAKLHDNGNFVLYGYDSQIVWESFDYPTDTLLGGQKLNLRDDHLTSNPAKYKLLMGKTSGAVCISDVKDEVHGWVTSLPLNTPATVPATLNLDTAGMLYLVNSNGAIRKIIYKNKKQQKVEIGVSSNVKEDYIYRATLDSRGKFILYKERIDGNPKSSSSSIQLWASYKWGTWEIFKYSLVAFALIVVVVLLVMKQYMR